MYLIKEYEGVNNIKFGYSSKKIEKIVMNKPKKFMKTKFDVFITDEYGDFYVYYDADGSCEAIEFFSLKQVQFKDICFGELNYQQIEEKMREIDSSLDIDECGFTSYAYGIGVYAPYKYEENAVVESVIIFKNGYYD